MKRTCFTTFGLFLLVVSPLIARADSSIAEDLQKQLSAGKFEDVAKSAGDALGAATGPDRFKLASLKAEALLNLKQADAAVEAFKAAAKETDDKKLGPLATATAMLIVKSPDFIYTSRAPRPAPKNPPRIPPKNPPKAPVKPVVVQPSTSTALALQPGQYDIIPQGKRSAAIAAFWTDERADAEKKIKDKADGELTGVKDAIDLIAATEPLAIAGGSPDWAAGQKSTIAIHVRLALGNTLKTWSGQVESIAKDQTKRRPKGQGKPMPTDQRGTLNTIIENLNKAETALKDLPTQLGIDESTYKGAIASIDKLQDRATTVLAQN